MTRSWPPFENRKERFDTLLLSCCYFEEKFTTTRGQLKFYTDIVQRDLIIKLFIIVRKVNT